MATDEAVQIDEVVQRLSLRFPSIAANSISDTVQQTYDTFAQAPVRGYVPLLVERSAVRTLQASPH